MTTERADEPLSWWRRLFLAVVAARPGWATAYARRQLRLADEDLVAAQPLAVAVERAADAVERSPRPALAERHRQLRRDYYNAVRAAERRIARSGTYRLAFAGLVADVATERVVRYVADEVAPELARIDRETAPAAR